MLINSNDLNRLFDELLGANTNYQLKTSVISKNDSNENNYEVYQTEDGAYLFFEAPGYNKDNLEIEMENGVISIQGKRTYKINGQEKTKKISKKFTIGESYDPESLEATIEDGLLTLFVPGYKKQESKKKINLN